MIDITLTIKKTELLWDIFNDTHIVAQGKFARGDKSQVAYFLQATEDDSDKNKLLRSLQLALSSLKTRLAYFVKNVTASTGNNTLTDTEDISLVLTVSTSFNQSYVTPLAELCHKYIMNMMLFDWFNATDTSIAKTYYELSQMAAGEIAGCFIKTAPARPAASEA